MHRFLPSFGPYTRAIPHGLALATLSLRFGRCARLLTRGFTLFILYSRLAGGQSIDPTFNPTDVGSGAGDGFNGSVQSIARQPDGKMLIGGGLRSYNSTPHNRIARLNADGSWTTPSTTSPGPYTLNLYTDNPVITLKAVQQGMAGGASFAYNWLAVCPTGNGARLGAEPGSVLSVVVLGNPVQHGELSVAGRGASGQAPELSLLNEQGHPVSQTRVAQAGVVEGATLRVGPTAGVYLLRGQHAHAGERRQRRTSLSHSGAGLLPPNQATRPVFRVAWFLPYHERTQLVWPTSCSLDNTTTKTNNPCRSCDYQYPACPVFFLIPQPTLCYESVYRLHSSRARPSSTVSALTRLAARIN